MTQQPETILWNGVSYRIVLPASASGGRLSIFETEDHPGYGPPRHIHHDADETFVLLQGHVDFLLGDVVTSYGPGETVFVPRGTLHSFCVRGTEPARMMTVMTPGGFEGFFREMAAEGLRIPQDMARIAAISAKYHQEMVGPPLV
jgi:mannose-6-phosphate isomerase-like protein (cupin superfamily)